MASLESLIRDSERVVIFTGAGISTESGIPDFRSPGGIWSRFKPVEFQDFLASEDSRVRLYQAVILLPRTPLRFPVTEKRRDELTGAAVAPWLNAGPAGGEGCVAHVRLALAATMLVLPTAATGARCVSAFLCHGLDPTNYSYYYHIHLILNLNMLQYYLDLLLK